MSLTKTLYPADKGECEITLFICTKVLIQIRNATLLGLIWVQTDAKVVTDKRKS